MMDVTATAERLEQADRIVGTGDLDPGRIHSMLTFVTQQSYEQAQPPYTLRAAHADRRVSRPQDAACHDWHGPSWRRYWYCRRHHVGGASISTLPTMLILPHGRIQEGGEGEEVCRT